MPWSTEHECQRVMRLTQGFGQADVLPEVSPAEVSPAEVAQVIPGAKCVVFVDARLSHLTVTLDKPNTILFGSADRGLTGGYGKAR